MILKISLVIWSEIFYIYKKTHYEIKKFTGNQKSISNMPGKMK